MNMTPTLTQQQRSLIQQMAALVGPRKEAFDHEVMRFHRRL
jgi:hypothetical protein